MPGHHRLEVRPTSWINPPLLEGWSRRPQPRHRPYERKRKVILHNNRSTAKKSMTYSQPYGATGFWSWKCISIETWRMLKTHRASSSNMYTYIYINIYISFRHHENYEQIPVCSNYFSFRCWDFHNPEALPYAQRFRTELPSSKSSQRRILRTWSIWLNFVVCIVDGLKWRLIIVTWHNLSSFLFFFESRKWSQVVPLLFLRFSNIIFSDHQKKWKQW